MLPGMLDGRMILRCHLFVPVWYWPVLWHYLARLEATAALARAEGRKGFMWHLEKNGVIWVSHMDASAAERAARGELPRDFDRTPWLRVSLTEPEIAGGWRLDAGCPVTGLSLAPFRPAASPSADPARAPP